MSAINTWPGWESVRLLGSGSYGKVYEIQKEEFGKIYKAALKVITIPRNQAEIDSAYSDGMDRESVTTYFRSIVERITDEFALMSDLKGYTNIVSYQDHMVVKHPDEIGWDILIRMELLTPLQVYSAEKALSEEEVIKLGCDICRALELCWDLKIIHRDIKPENIFVNKRGDFELGDFGIARTVEGEMTRGTFAGTETYMAPEVYRGQEYGHTADLYSLAVVLYRYLNNNRTPFLPMENILAGDRERAKNERMSGAPVPPPVNGSEGLKQVVRKALSYRPEDRYQTAADFRAALEACRQGDLNPMDPPPASLPGPMLDDTMHSMPAEERSFGGQAQPQAVRGSETVKAMSEQQVPPMRETGKLAQEPGKQQPVSDGTVQARPVQKEQEQPKKNSRMAILKASILFLIALWAVRMIAAIIGGGIGQAVRDSGSTSGSSMEDEIVVVDDESETDCTAVLDQSTIFVEESTGVALHVGDYIYRNDEALTWTSSDPSVATVESDGTVTGVAEGTATITGSYDGQEASVDIVVENALLDDGSSMVTETQSPSNMDRTVEYLEVYLYTDVILAGDSVDTRLKADDWIILGNVADWSTDDPSVATVDSQGVITAHASGNCTLTAEYGGQMASQEITVVEVDKSAGATVTADYGKISLSQYGEDTVRLTVSGNTTERITVTAYYNAGKMFGLEWGEWEENTVPLTISEGNLFVDNTGTGYVTILVYETDDPDHYIASTKIEVRVNG